jgi:hypothetical protein
MDGQVKQQNTSHKCHMSLMNLSSLSVLSKAWPLALNEHLFATSNKSLLCATCFLTLLCSLLLSLFIILLMIHLAINDKVVCLRSAILWA